MKKVYFIVIMLLSSINVMANNLDSDRTKIFTVGIIPVETQQEIFRKWNPLFKELGLQTPFKFKISTNKTVSEYEDFLRLKAYDFALVSHHQYKNVIDDDDYKVFTLSKKVEKELYEKIEKNEVLYYFVVKKEISDLDLQILRDRSKELKKTDYFRRLVDSIEFKSQVK